MKQTCMYTGQFDVSWQLHDLCARLPIIVLSNRCMMTPTVPDLFVP
jgi:hypothetical protein